MTRVDDIQERLIQFAEGTIVRVVLHRLAEYVVSGDLPAEKLAAIAPLIFTGSRAIAFLKKHLPDPNAIDWDASLDRLAEELDWDI